MKPTSTFFKAVLLAMFIASAQALFSQDIWNGSGVSTITDGKIGLSRLGVLKWNLYNDSNDDLHINTGNGAQPRITINQNGLMEFGSQSHTKFNIASVGTGVNPYLHFSKDGVVRWSFYNSYYTDDLLFASSTGGESNVKMMIKQNGKVGIGTTSPSHSLSVIGGTEEVLYLQGGNHTILELQSLGDFHSYLRFKHDGFHKWDLTSESTGDLRIHDYALDERRVAISAEDLSFMGAAHGVISVDSQLGFNSYVQFRNSGNVKWDVASETGGNFRIYDHLQGQHRLVITPAGNVGIGTSTPDTKLTVKGTVHTEEVWIDLEGALVPDYVFEENYNLPSLPEVEAYIKANKHLPEVPSAKEMDANGINIKEMNLLLLKKVEELTLHLIEMNTRLLNVEKENQELKETITEKEKK